MEARLGQQAAMLPNFGGDDRPLMPESTAFRKPFKHLFPEKSDFFHFSQPGAETALPHITSRGTILTLPQKPCDSFRSPSEPIPHLLGKHVPTRGKLTFP